MPHRIEKALFSHFFARFLGSHYHGTTIIIRIIIQVTHYDNLRTWFFHIDTIAHLFAQHRSCITCRTTTLLTTRTTWPVIHTKVYLIHHNLAVIIQHIARHPQLQTTSHHAAIRIMCLQFIAFRLTYRLKHIWIIQEANIYSTTIRALQQDWHIITVVLLLQFFAQIMQTTYILYLRHTHTCCSTRIFIRAQLSNSICHILNLLLVLKFGPLHTTIWQIFIVILAFVMNSIKHVFQVIERNATNYHLIASRVEWIKRQKRKKCYNSQSKMSQFHVFYLFACKITTFFWIVQNFFVILQ